ncbi:MAG: cytochrome c biogenesis protein CcdA [Alphaproteobacteria bacterium]|nr:cytochrome c biogenesis protein CcdA [Alphaproteobacteria bacterium]
MKKGIFVFIAILGFWGLGIAQSTDSLVQFRVKVNSLKNNNIALEISAQPQKGWYIYQNNAIEGLHDISLNIDTQQFQFKEPYKLILNTNKLEKIKDPIFETNAQVIQGGFVLQQTLINAQQAALINGTIDFFISNGKEFYPISNAFSIALQSGKNQAADLFLKNITPKVECGGSQVVSSKETSLLNIFILGFLGGLIALLTPCVFPMLPITVSFFTNKSSNRRQAIRNGLLYGLCIFGFYVAASIPFHLLGDVNPELFNNIATNAWLNLIFFIIFLFFAISFFGYFEITLPSGLASKVDSKKGLGSISGIFFMALTLVIVSFSCTGPILGTLLVGSLTAGPWPLTAGLAGFGVALALPFSIFSIFPNYLKSLPKSGSWLDSVKKILAFIELALALKFFSNADLVKQWGLLKRETFIVIWVIILIALLLYLIGKLKLPHDYPQPMPLWKKIVFAFTLVFTIYILGGLFKLNQLSLLSGFPPPTNYSWNKQHSEIKGIHIVNNYDEAIKQAQITHKIVLVDFTGWACVNCRKMEENVWTNPDVAQFMKDNCIVASLYVDDRTNLDPSQQFIFNMPNLPTTNVITQGDKWTLFESLNFKQVSQPLYVLINENQQVLNNPISYTPNPQEYLKWLQCGFQAK